MPFIAFERIFAIENYVVALDQNSTIKKTNIVSFVSVR